ncbi:MAG: hypothetical protein M5U16_13130 [Hyphomicrobium sp.]|nr:hypothetical protein [Hyphomicrobium sp.]
MSSNVTPKPLPTPDVSPETPVGAAAEVGALERLQRLNEEMRARARPEVVEAPKQRAPKRLGEKVNALRARRGVKSLIAIIVAVALGWYPLQRLLAATSAEATVNARLINLRAPIDGKVSLVAPSIAVGTEVEPDEPSCALPTYAPTAAVSMICAAPSMDCGRRSRYCRSAWGSCRASRRT